MVAVRGADCFGCEGAAKDGCGGDLEASLLGSFGDG